MTKFKSSYPGKVIRMDDIDTFVEQVWLAVPELRRNELETIYQEIWAMFPESSGIDTGAVVREMRNEDISLVEAKYERIRRQKVDLEALDQVLVEFGLS